MSRLGAEPEFWALTAHGEPRRVLSSGAACRHGLATIVEAAARLGERASFVVIGRGPDRAAAEARARTLGVAIEWRDEVPLAALPAELARAAVVLGVFGAGRKAAMVVPNKVYQAAAAVPAVTRRGPLRYVLVRRALRRLSAERPDALARAVATLLAMRRGARRGAASRPSRSGVRAALLAAALAETLETRSASVRSRLASAVGMLGGGADERRWCELGGGERPAAASTRCSRRSGRRRARDRGQRSTGERAALAGRTASRACTCYPRRERQFAGA